MFPANNQLRNSGLIFGCCTLLFVISRIALFNGFNGSDDLHYAMLASKMLRGQLDPFQPNDIFSGRVLLIGWQALVYKTGGITLFTTNAGIMLAVILTAYITVFKFLPDSSPGRVLLASSFIYFFPSLPNYRDAISPGPYIMLTGACIVVLLKRALFLQPSRTAAALYAGIGVLTGLSLLIKETALLFLLLTTGLILLYRRREGISSIGWVWLGFGLVMASMAGIYLHFTGDALFKITQIRNSAYLNPCNFTGRPIADLINRLTYGIWMAFTLHEFFPFIFGGAVFFISSVGKQP